MFYIFALLTVLAAGGVVFFRNLFYAALSLLVTLLSLAAIYILLYADFVAITQLMVYVGGVLVLLLFGIMLSTRGETKSILSDNVNTGWGILTGILLLAGLTYLISEVPFAQLSWQQEIAQNIPAKTTIPAIGINLMTTFVLPFEVASLLLLIALIGAAYISTGTKK